MRAAADGGGHISLPGALPSVRAALVDGGLRASALQPDHGPRIDVLNGWRAVSILFVVASHMLPVGPKRWELNEGAGEIGMALFFCLSGFLVTTQLQKNHNLLAFYIRRLFRILPLALPVILGVALVYDQSLQNLAMNLLFVENYLFWALMPGLGHFWSLCVEMHFYLFIGVALWATRFRSGVVFWAWIGFTIYRSLEASSGTI